MIRLKCQNATATKDVAYTSHNKIRFCRRVA